MFEAMDGYTRSLLIFAGIHVIAAYSFYAPFKTGQVSLGQAGFMAVGAYGSAILTQKFGLPFAAGLVFGGLVAGVIGVLVGFPALRIKGIYLLLLTLGFAEIMSVIALSWEYVGGAQGFRNISFNPFTLEYVLAIIVLLAGALTATILAAWRAQPAAAWLLIPYLAWVLYATTLNAGIVALNPR